MKKSYEVNFDGLVGNTHNYGGLSHGNVASTRHWAAEANPLQAVLQGLQKMKSLSDLGMKQGVFPPQERPDLGVLRSLGFSGSDKAVLSEAAQVQPDLLYAVNSASSMWVANAATVSPSGDTADRKVHFTPANLISKFHRSLEPQTTAALLKRIFKSSKYFVHHDPLPSSPAYGDEGAANHTRFCANYGGKGIEFFVFGRYGLRAVPEEEPKKFPARQTYEASVAVARRHGLKPSAVIFGQQNPAAIDAGVFHNDVAGVGNQNVYFYHEHAYAKSKALLQELQRKYSEICGGELILIEVSEKDVSLGEAVNSYLFNSQLITTEPGRMALVAPTECQENEAVTKYLQKFMSDSRHPVEEVRFYDLRQSMRNGGGPACLRLRVALTEAELAAVNSKTLMNEKLYVKLVAWAKKHYRDRLALDDLRDPQLIKESRRCLDELTQILGLGSIYGFQK